MFWSLIALCLVLVSGLWTSPSGAQAPVEAPPPAAPAQTPDAGAPSEPDAPPAADAPPPSDAPVPAAPPSPPPAAPVDVPPAAPPEGDQAPAEPTPAPDVEAPPAEQTPTPTAPAPLEPAPGEVVEVQAAPSDVQPPEPELPATAAPTEAIEVTVVGTTLAKTAGSAHVVSNRELERWEYDDPHAALTSVPGVYVRQEDGMGLRPNIGLRGVNPDRSKKVTLLEDGVLFGPAPYSAPAAYYFPLITRMTQLKVIKGPSAISQGPQTVAGAIDVITRPIPATATASADVAVGQYGYGKAHVYGGVSNEQFGFLVEGVRLQNNGFKELPDDADTGFARNEWMIKASYTLDPTAKTRNEFRAKLTYADETSNETYLGLSDADFERNPNQRYGVSQLDRMRYQRASFVLTHVLEHDKLSLTTNAYRHDFRRTWRKVNGFRGVSLFDVLRSPDAESHKIYTAILHGEDTPSVNEAILIGPNQRDFISQGVDSRLRFDAVTGKVAHRLEAGVRYHYDTIDRRHSENGFLQAGGELVPDGGATVVTAFNTGTTHAVSLYALHALTWAGLTITPGLRAELMRFSFEDRLADSDQQRFEWALLPGLGAYYAITEELGVLSGVYRGFSPPPPEASDDTKPENSVNYEGGARYTWKTLRVEGIAFYNHYTNLTDLCTYSSGCNQTDLDQQFDAGKARIYGVEAFAQHDIRVGKFKLPLLASYTFTRTAFLSTFESSDPIFGEVSKGDAMPYVPTHQLRGALGFEERHGGASVGLTYVSAMREEPGRGDVDDGLHTDDQFILDVTGQARITDYLQLYLNVQNLLDSQYVVSHRPFGARPNAPRWLHVGIKATL